MAERQPVLGEEGLGLGAAQPRLEGRGHRDLVDGEQPLHPHQVEADQPREPVAPRGQATGDRGAATEGDDRHPVLHGPGQDGLHVVVPVGPDDGVGCVVEVAGAGAQQVGGGLAPRAEGPRRVVGQHVLGTDGRPEVVEQRVVQRGRRRRRPR